MRANDLETARFNMVAQQIRPWEVIDERVLGTYQAGCIVALAVFGITKDQALGFSIVVHAVQLVTSVAVGLPFMVSSFGKIGNLFTVAVAKSRQRDDWGRGLE